MDHVVQRRGLRIAHHDLDVELKKAVGEIGVAHFDGPRHKPPHLDVVPRQRRVDDEMDWVGYAKLALAGVKVVDERRLVDDEGT
jgi:hypothetical protein